MKADHMQIDHEATEHFQTGVRDAIRQLRTSLPTQIGTTRDELCDMVQEFYTQHTLSMTNALYGQMEGKPLGNNELYRLHMMTAVTGVLVAALTSMAQDNNSQWDDDYLWEKQFWHHVDQCASKIRAGHAADD